MTTETNDPRYRGLDAWPLGSVTAALLDGQLAAAAAARAQAAALADAAAAAAARLARDGGEAEAGRLIYVGAGASGRLAAQDGAELWPTFGWPHARLVCLMAGGEPALLRSVEGAEDDAAAAAAQVAALAPTPRDVALCVAASGRTPFVLGAAQALRAAGALVVGLSSNPATPLLAHSDHGVLLDTGAEVIAGSTRMAAGTAQKIALNVLSTAIMVALGRVHDNLMVDMAASNAKLDVRRVAMLRAIAPVDASAARIALDAAAGHVKTAALIASGATAAEAAALLDAAGGRLRAALAALRADGRG